MNLQEELKALKERIAELEEQEKDEQELPQYDYEYWYVDFDGSVFSTFYDNNHYIDRYHQEIGNIFKTKKQAEFAVEKLKVEAELQKFSRPFESMEGNFCMVFDTSDGSIDFWSMSYSKVQGTIYFESTVMANEAINAIGEDRIKKYIFGVED
ncbi:hypothetical protein ACUW9Z_000906 [Aerococcus sp. 150760007-1]|uniref:Uncharacterized protein n=1 Tax=Aerococcus urinaeequi TaxID=51665 RepID=A0ABR5ZXY0_9LACT|nr:hypothetical protein [Aerococcus urinaeequi]MBA5746564.1 hypothetical protein [Aerococcus urinaeequi]MBA5829385.1 hypothetical protein [Aerococcus urinaeequi]MBA5860252.1 hypothetical protein [Aerococcus urinaeequi]